MLRALILLALAFAATAARADEVAVEWQSEAGAAQYELQVKREGKVVFDKRFPAEEGRWRGNLPFGAYQYQLRTIDRTGRAGPWGDPVSFVVQPQPPQLFAPADGTTVLYSFTSAVPFRWSETPGVDRYEIALRTPAGLVKHVVKGNGVGIPNLLPGEYAWQVKPVLSQKGAAQTEVNDAKASAVARFRLDLVKDAEKYADDFQKITLAAPASGAPFEVADYLCLYPVEGPKASPVACGKIAGKGDQTISMNLVVQQRRIEDGGKYHLASPTKPLRGPASFNASNTYQVASERGRFNFDVTGGLTVGTNYFFPTFEAQAAMLPGFALGLRYFFASDEQAGASLKLSGVYLTATKYFGRKNFNGFFAQGAVGEWSFSAKRGAQEQSGRVSLAGAATIGWQLRPASQGLNATFGMGAQYVDGPKVTLATTRLRYLLPLVTVLFGYSF